MLRELKKRALDEFIRRTFLPKKIILVHQQTLLASDEKKEYISVSKSCRLLVISYVNNRKVLAQEFIEA